MLRADPAVPPPGAGSHLAAAEQDPANSAQTRLQTPGIVTPSGAWEAARSWVTVWTQGFPWLSPRSAAAAGTVAHPARVPLLVLPAWASFLLSLPVLLLPELSELLGSAVPTALPAAAGHCPVCKSWIPQPPAEPAASCCLVIQAGSLASGGAHSQSAPGDPPGIPGLALQLHMLEHGMASPHFSQ